MEKEKKTIIDTFLNNVAGKKFDHSACNYNARHDGAEGHWLETLMGLSHNASNAPDLLGYEMKKGTKSKTTFGDWSPDIALWKERKPYEEIHRLDRDSEFLKFFGKPNEKKRGRPSWSGEPAPKINHYNSFGQILDVDNEQNIRALYSYSKDSRANKSTLLPVFFHKEELVLAIWEKESLKGKLERKFNQKGWFKCYKNDEGFFTSIGFGPPMNYERWLTLVRRGIVFFDSGM